MALEKNRRTFISYSRLNKEFALQLARELRASGFNIWLDQLDIPTGSRWDDELERALEDCEIFLVIMTPDSIASENVKDEIGYAIDNNKRILPLLLENAKIPLRLRRFQYVDFTAISYDEGVDKAKKLLTNLINENTIPGGMASASRSGSAPEKKESETKVEGAQSTRSTADGTGGGQIESDKFRTSRENVIKASDFLSRGKKYLDENNLAKAAECFREVLAITPNHAETKKLLEETEAKLAQMGGSQDANDPSARKADSDQIAKQKADEENLAKARAETDRKIKEEADRLAAQKASAELAAKKQEDAIRSAQAKADSDRRAREEAEKRLAAQRQEAVRLAQSRADTERRAREEAEKQLAAQKKQTEKLSGAKPKRSFLKGMAAGGVVIVVLCIVVVGYMVLSNTNTPATKVPVNPPISISATVNKPVNVPASDTPKPPTLVPDPGIPALYNFQVCLDFCDGSNSATFFDASAGITALYIQFDFENFEPGAPYTRTWTNRGDPWITYTCAWDGPSSGTEFFQLTEPGGLSSGIWEMTVTVNGVEFKEGIELVGTWDFWDPVIDPINKCRK